MPSILPDFEYDIFISYRHNDNLDGWVTNFVESLEKELRGTLKESLTLYFDKNPHDGLLETHNVDKSLEGKLKSLIFIPIISQTYCDSKSFAWQHEFCSFNKLAQENQLGRDIKVGNGNVASRILPIKIHDLDAEDTATIEEEIKGVLRGIEFIHRSAGVNRPLTHQDDQVRESGKILYRDQVNKVANAVKDIITSINPTSKSLAARTEDKIVRPIKSPRKLGAIISVIVLILALASYFSYPKISSTSTPEEIEKSIAVLPFVDMSATKDQEYLGDGIAEEIITSLSKLKELKVIGRTSSFQFKGKNIDLREIGEKLNVNSVLEGSVMKSGNKLRITAQLINVEDGSHIWSERYDREMEDVFVIQDDIARSISSKISVSELANEQPRLHTNSLKAYEYYLKGQLINGVGQGDKARPYFEKAIQLDSTYIDAYAGLGEAYLFSNSGAEQGERILQLATKVLALNPQSGRGYDLLFIYQSIFNFNWEKAKEAYDHVIALTGVPTMGHSWILAMTFGDLERAIQELTVIVGRNPMDREAVGLLGYFLGIDRQYELGSEWLNKAIAIDPSYPVNYERLAIISTLNRRFEKVLELNDKTESLGLGSRVDRIWHLAKMGRMQEARDIYTRTDPGKWSAYDKAVIHFSFGELDEGFKWFEHSYQDNKAIFITNNLMSPHFEDIRDDPRFKSLVSKLNLPTNF